jgi:hypothetical protein
MLGRCFHAAILGTQAFKDGKSSVPCHDSDLMDLTKDLDVGEGAAEIMKYWAAAWEDAQLAKKLNVE